MLIVEGKNFLNNCEIHELERVFNELLNYYFKNELTLFRGVKIINRNFPNKYSVARMENGYVLLPKNSISKLIKNDMQLLKSNIYHELCHIYLLEKYPKIHKLYNIAKQKEKYIKAFTMLFFIEYLANILSVPLESDSTIKKYINSVNDYSWNFDDWESELFFIKNSPYIIVRKNDKRIINSVKIKNEII